MLFHSLLIRLEMYVAIEILLASHLAFHKSIGHRECEDIKTRNKKSGVELSTPPGLGHNVELPCSRCIFVLRWPIVGVYFYLC